MTQQTKTWRERFPNDPRGESELRVSAFINTFAEDTHFRYFADDTEVEKVSNWYEKEIKEAEIRAKIEVLEKVLDIKEVTKLGIRGRFKEESFDIATEELKELTK